MPLSVVGDFETRDDDELDEFISAWRAVAALPRRVRLASRTPSTRW